MTSVSQQPQTPSQASNSTSTTSSAPSYASATKKAVSSPPIATGSSNNSPAVAVSGTEPVQQNAKSSNISPVNGRAAITPAVPSFTPAIAHSNASNGADHGRTGSVTIPANGGFSNGGPVGGQKAGIQFGSIADSPQISHSTPQLAQPTPSSAPINIPGNPRIPSPAQSPSPIPQPAASGGGRPPSGLSSNGVTFGSLHGDGDRHMRQASGSQTQAAAGAQAHIRRESSGDMNHQGPGSSGRGGYQGGRGRGGYNNNNNNGGSYPQQPMYNPQQAAFRPGAQNQGRGGMPQFQNQGRPQMQYPGSPHQVARSPALSHAMPGTPNMSQAMPMQSPQFAHQQYYMGGPQGVQHPSTFYTPSPSPFHQPSRGGRGKKSKYTQQTKHPSRPRQDSHGQIDGPVEVFRHVFGAANGSDGPNRSERGSSTGSTSIFSSQSSFSPLIPSPGTPWTARTDYSPESGNFDHYLTERQNYPGYPQQYDHRGMPMPNNPYAQMQYPQVGYMPQSPQPGYQQPYSVGQYNQPGPQPMSRTSSQISERPNSSLGQPQTPSQIPSNTHTPQPKPTPSNTFQRPKSKAIQIKRPDGELLDLSIAKPPASPAPSNRSRTPEVTSTPTPPPKSATPLHTRTDSATANGKTQEQIRNEFKEAMRKAAEAEKTVEPKAKTEDATVDPAVSETKAPEVIKATEEVKAPEVAKSVPEVKPVEEAKPVEEVKLVENAEESKVEEAESAEAAAKRKQEEEDAELERQIQEMEEAELAREKAEEEMSAKRAAQKAAAEKEKAEKAKADAVENDRKLQEQEREMERLEDEREKKRLAAEAGGADGAAKTLSVAEALAAAATKDESKDVTEEKSAPATPSTLAAKLSNLTLDSESGTSTPNSDTSMGPPAKVSAGKERVKPTALNLAPLNSKPIEAPQPSAALQSLKSARFLTVINESLYPEGIKSPMVGVNHAVASKGKSFKYDTQFLLQFQKVFVEKPSMEFESQIKTLIGDTESGSARTGSARGTGSLGPRSTSNRNAPGSFAMGNFGAVGGKTLPPGTSSAERFAMSQGTLPRPGGAVNAFNRPGTSFGAPMARGPSSTGMGSTMGPGGQRVASGRNASGRNNSKRTDYKDKQQEAQAAKAMPLTANMELKPIAVTATGWKPRSLVAQSSATGAAGPAPGASGSGTGHMEPDMVQRKVKAALNKMTPEKFDKIADQILAIAGQSKDEADGRTLRQVIQLTFEKATDEAHWASMYAKFCKKMLENMSPEIKDESIMDKNGNVVSGGNLFRKYLLNRCQEEFERGWKMNLPDKPEGEEGDAPKNEEAAMLSDEYYIAAAAKRRGLGLVAFIGELYKLNMLTERIMHECVKKLVDYTGIPEEAEIESLTKLLRTIGGNLDSTEKGHPMMDVYFQRIQSLVDTPELPSRIRFMLMDVVDLRKKRWQSKEDNKGPKTLEEVRAEAEAAAAAKAAENARGSQRGGGGRMQSGRGDARNFSNQFGNQPPPDYNRNTVATDDLRRLGKSGSSRTTGGPMSFAPTSMFSSRSNSGRKMGPGGSLSRTGEDSGASSRTGTPPQQKEKEPTTSANAFSLLQQLDDNNETENPASPPLVAASPALPKASLDSAEREAES